MRTADVADGGVEEMMGREVQEAAVELDVRTEASQNDAFKAVIADFFGDALKVMKSMEVTGKETLQPLVGEKLDIEHFAEGKDHEKAVGYSVADPAGIGPVYLGFFCREGLDVEKGSFFKL